MTQSNTTSRAWLTRTVLAAGACCMCILLSGSHSITMLDKILTKGQITVMSRNGPTTYYEGRAGLTGFEYSLAKAFADHLGVRLEIREEEDLGNMFTSLGSEQGDLAASGLTITAEREAKVNFSTPYLTITQQLIYRHGTGKPQSIEDLYGKDLLVIKNSAHAENLRKLQQQYPQLQWTERADVEMFDLIEMVNNGEIEYTIVDSNAYDLNRNIFPRTQVAFDISEQQQLAWAFPKQKDDSFYKAAQTFFSLAQASGTLADIHDYYYGNLEDVDRGSALVLANRIEQRLPQYRQFMEAAGSQFGIEWELLAAVSYQESHWNPRATSPTGVRGMMMLTQATAQEMGVSKRTDPEQSIVGGAQYLKKIYDRLPDGIEGQDRVWMTLAAYNVGFGHLEDARVLTEINGSNPNRWEDVQQQLPKLAKRKYYRNTKHGYARGWEPVAYVNNIRSFYNVLAWHSQMETRRLAMYGLDSQALTLASDQSAQSSSLDDNNIQVMTQL